MPHMTLQSALWHSTPVTVKRYKGGEDSRRLLLKEADLLRWSLFLDLTMYTLSFQALLRNTLVILFRELLILLILKIKEILGSMTFVERPQFAFLS